MLIASIALRLFITLASVLSSEVLLNTNASITLQYAFPHGSPSNPAALPITSSRLVMYIQTFKDRLNNAISLLPLIEHNTGVTHIIIGSFHLHDEPGKIMLNHDPPDSPMYDEMWKEVEILQRNGVKILGLLGGAAAGTYARLSGTDENFQSFYDPIVALINKHHLDGLDVDIEEDVDVAVPLRLLHALHRDMGPEFILTMAPLASAISDEAGQNLSGFSYFALDALAVIPDSDMKLVSWYNAQFYGGFARDIGFYKSIVDAGWDPSRVVMGVLDSADGGNGNGFVKLETLRETIGELRRRYNAFGGVAGWEYWDAGWTDEMRPWEWVRSIGLTLFDVLEDRKLQLG